MGFYKEVNPFAEIAKNILSKSASMWLDLLACKVSVHKLTVELSIESHLIENDVCQYLRKLLENCLEEYKYKTIIWNFNVFYSMSSHLLVKLKIISVLLVLESGLRFYFRK